MSPFFVSLTVAADTETQWSRAYNLFVGIAAELGPNYRYVNICSQLRDEEDVLDEPTETVTEFTIGRVHQALIRSGLSEEQADNALTEMQNAGILFRERV